MSSILWKVRWTFVSRANSSVGTQSCATPPGRSAGLPEPTRPLYVRVLDSTGAILNDNPLIARGEPITPASLNCRRRQLGHVRRSRHWLCSQVRRSLRGLRGLRCRPGLQGRRSLRDRRGRRIRRDLKELGRDRRAHGMRGSDGLNGKSGRVRTSRTSCLRKTLERLLLFAPGECGGQFSL